MRALVGVAALALASCLTQRADLDVEPPEVVLEVRREKDAGGKLVREQMVLAPRGQKPIPHGADKGWYADGSKRFEREFDHGAPQGTWRTWHANGQLESETTFGETESPMRFWYDSGIQSSEGPALNGSRCGTWRFHRPDGSLRETGTYVGSLRDGSWTMWDKDGKQSSVRYVKGVIVERIE